MFVLHKQNWSAAQLITQTLLKLFINNVSGSGFQAQQLNLKSGGKGHASNAAINSQLKLTSLDHLGTLCSLYAKELSNVKNNELDHSNNNKNNSILNNANNDELANLTSLNAAHNYDAEYRVIDYKISESIVKYFDITQQTMLKSFELALAHVIATPSSTSNTNIHSRAMKSLSTILNNSLQQYAVSQKKQQQQFIQPLMKSHKQQQQTFQEPKIKPVLSKHSISYLEILKSINSNRF